MSSKILIPDLGGIADAEVIELLVQIGDVIQKDSPILVLEGEKATVEIPSPMNGVVKKITCKVGDKLISGQEVMEVEQDDTVNQAPTPSPSSKQFLDIVLPDVGSAADIKIIDVLIKPDDIVKKDDSILTLESEKASMDIPSPYAGRIVKVIVSEGSEVNEGDILASIEVDEPDESRIEKQSNKTSPQRENSLQAHLPPSSIESFKHDPNVHASPSVRRVAREFGVELGRVKGTGRKERIVIQDVQTYVKQKLQEADQGIKIPSVPTIDYGKFGEIENQELTKIKQFTGEYVHRAWISVPHVTHFDESDITELEKYRKKENASLASDRIKLTPLVFIMKATVDCLKEFPAFNSSLSDGKKQLILKKYFNIGVAVDTPKGLVVPVIRDVDKKDIQELSLELLNISNKAREKGLTSTEMAGSTFTISSLGGIGGTGFTPIVNTPDVAIMGVSKAKIQPVYTDGKFEPRLILPFSLSYDHRVIDGAEAARFCKKLSMKLTNIREMI